MNPADGYHLDPTITRGGPSRVTSVRNHGRYTQETTQAHHNKSRNVNKQSPGTPDS